jgi:hypothetical protein
LGLPEHTVFALEHQVTAHTFGGGLEEIADPYLFSRLERDDGVLAGTGNRCHLCRGDGHLHNTRLLELKVPPGARGDLRSGFVGDDDVV